MSVRTNFAFLFLIFSISIVAQAPDFIKKLQIQRLSESIKIDGNLTEAEWKTHGITKFYQGEPNQGEPATEITEAWVTFDDDAIYVAAHCYDSKPDSILANLARRDYSTISDQFTVYFDTFNDKQSGFYFGITPSGQQKDGILQNDTQSDMSWDGVWEGSAKITNDGWTLEIRIPYSQLRFAELQNYIWGINFRRDISRKKEYSYLVYTPRNESGFVSRFPELIGLEKINPPQRFTVLPYVTGKAEYLQHEPGNPFNTGSKYSPVVGVDIKYGLGSNLTLDATVNPDFGQVEVDPAVVNLGDTEIYFSENRPFFTEGMSIFRFGNGGANRNSTFGFSAPTLFYSRRIGRAPQGSIPANDFADVPTGTRILGAGKISGRVFNNWKFGTIQAITKREYADLQINNEKFESEIEPLTYYGIARAQKDYNAGKQGLGFLATYTNRFFNDEKLRSNINSNAVVGGMDGWTFLDDKKDYVLTGWFSASRVSGTHEKIIQLQRSSLHYYQRPDSKLSVDSSATSLSGYAGRLFLNKQAGTWWMNASLGVVSPGYNTNDLGYQSRTNILNWHLQYVKVWNTPTELYRNSGVGDCIFQTYDYDGNNTTFGNYLWGYITFVNYWSVNFDLVYNPSTVNNRRTRGGPLTLDPVARYFDLNFYSDQKNPVSFSTYFNGGSSISNYYTVGGSVDFKPSTNISLSIGPSFSKATEAAQWVGSYSDVTANQTYGRRYVFGTLGQTEISADIRLDWILTPTLSLQLYVQPLISSGKYSDLKQLAKSRSFDFTKYGDENSTINKVISSNGNVTYELDADGNGPSPVYKVGSPDFSYTSLRGNAVLRWEYLPGSTLYLVWTQSRAGFESNGDFQFGHSLDNLMIAQPDNIFMIKMTYWLGK